MTLTDERRYIVTLGKFKSNFRKKKCSRETAYCKPTTANDFKHDLTAETKWILTTDREQIHVLKNKIYTVVAP